ncbi:MAG TPA: TIGR03560 family F420-dependent LLM class oxidoreductase [Acidimicrobiales bacterium]
MTLTRFGFHFASTSYEDLNGQPLFDRIAEVAAAAESAGFDSIWVPDHAHQNRIGGGPSGPMLEAYTLLAALAMKTGRVLLGSLVSPITFREPALLAKVVTTLDVVSGGRAVLGIGAAWDTEEHEAYGFDFPNIAEREDRLEESILICREMFTASPASFDGEHYHLREAWNAPHPIQARIPILVGGGGERRTLAAVAKYGDACNFFGAPDVVQHKLDVLAEHCTNVGRDITEISTTCALFAPESTAELIDQVGERLALGIEGAVVFGGACPSAEVVTQWGAALHQAFD